MLELAIFRAIAFGRGQSRLSRAFACIGPFPIRF
jgi:hypothetical protein